MNGILLFYVVYNINILQTEKNIVLLKTYHGTNLSSAFDIWIHGVDLNKSLSNLDFGKGFYVTDDKQKAIQEKRTGFIL